MHGHCPNCRSIFDHTQISNKGDVKGHMINRYIIKSPVIQSQPAERLKVAIASTSEMTSSVQSNSHARSGLGCVSI